MVFAVNDVSDYMGNNSVSDSDSKDDQALPTAKYTRDSVTTQTQVTQAKSERLFDKTSPEMYLMRRNLLNKRGLL
jgi:hypothetical protein